MAAIAERTRRVRLGTGVLLPALRNPVVLAHIVGTLDRVAEGRVILGVGIAADTPAIRKEFEAAGVPFERRVGRFLETLEICRALWGRDGVSFSGKHFVLENVSVEPKPHRPGGPPIWIGGSGPTALREAARFDAWFPTGPSVEFFAEHFPRIAKAYLIGRAADLFSATLAGRSCRAFSVRPRDAYRYGYRILVDEETAVPLQVELLGSDGVALEQIMFTQISYPAQISDAALKPAVDAGRFVWIRHRTPPVPEPAAATRWVTGAACTQPQ